MADDYLSDDIIRLAELQDMESAKERRRRRAIIEGKGDPNKRQKQDAGASLTPKLETRMESSRSEGLAVPIAKENVGHRLLALMGYKEGSAIGKRASGRTAPIDLHVKANREGLGMDTLRKEQTAQRERLHRAVEAETVASFRLKERSKADFRRAVDDLERCQIVCQMLDKESGITENVLWPKPSEPAEPEAASVLADSAARTRQSHADRARTLRGAREESDETSVEGTLQALKLTIEYLRRVYHYCAYCGIKFESPEDMQQSCPGPFFGDHADEAVDSLSDTFYDQAENSR